MEKNLNFIEGEIWESPEPEVDINELNKSDITNRTPATVRIYFKK